MVGLKLLGTSYLFNNNNCITNLWYLAIIFSIYTWFSWHCFTCYQINSQNGLQPSFHHFKLIEHFKLNPFDSSGNLVLQTLLSPIAIKVKHPTSNLSKQTVNAEIFLTLNSSFISIGQLCDDGCILKFDQHKIIIRKQHNYFWRLLGSSKRIMALLVIWTIPSQPTIQHKSKHKKTLVSTYQSNGNASYQGILPNIPTRISHFLPPYSLLPNKMHPSPGNQLWVLLNMDMDHTKTTYKVSPRVRNCFQSSPWPTETTTSCRSCYKYHTCINQYRGGVKAYSAIGGERWC